MTSTRMAVEAKNRPGPRPARKHDHGPSTTRPSGRRWSKKMPKSATHAEPDGGPKVLGSNCCCFKTMASDSRGTALRV